MASWPASLQQEPNIDGYSRTLKPNVIRSAMGYGPDKIRRRTTMDLYVVTIQVWLDYPQLATFDQFYKDNMSLPWDWLDFGVQPNVPAVYTFLASPTVAPIGPLNFSATMSLEMSV